MLVDILVVSDLLISLLVFNGECNSQLVQQYVKALVFYRFCRKCTTCLFTRLGESSLVPTGFLTAQFLQEMLFMMPLF